MRFYPCRGKAVSMAEARTREGLRYVVETDGHVVWVNSEKGLIGRFNARGGVDVHNTPGKEPVCADCSPAPDWERFKAGMLRVHGVVVDDRYRPPGELRRAP